MYLLQFYSDSNDQNVIRRVKIWRIFHSLKLFVYLSAFERYKFISESSPVSPVSPLLGSPPLRRMNVTFAIRIRFEWSKRQKKRKNRAHLSSVEHFCVSLQTQKIKFWPPPPHFSPVSPVLPTFQENEWISVSFDPIFVFKTVPKIINSGLQLAPSTVLIKQVEGWKFVHAPQESGTWAIRARDPLF